LPYFTGSGTATYANFTSYGRTLAALVDAAAGRTALGLGTLALQAANNVAITGGAINGTTIGATTPSTGAFTTLTVNDNTTLGSSNSDTVNFNARVASHINPATDDTYDLGVTGHEWRNLNIDGTANIDSLVADTADINGGTIDGTAIGAVTPSTGQFTTCRAGIAFYMGSANDGSTGQIAVAAGDTYFDYDGLLRFRALDAGTATILTLGTAGAAVTGALSSTGNLTLSATNSNILGGTTTGSSSIYNSTGAAGFTIYGPTHATKANHIDVFAGLLGHTFNSSGFALSGAFTATGNGTFGGGGVSGTLLASNAGVDTTAYTAGSYNANHRLWLGTGNATNTYAAIRFSGSGGVHEGLFGTVQNASGNAEFFWNLYSGSSYAERLRLSATGLAVSGTLTTSSTTLHTSSVSLTNGAGAGAGTLTNAPTAGNPTKWIAIVDNGTTRYIPAW
jgi:hypothetical protein